MMVIIAVTTHIENNGDLQDHHREETVLQPFHHLKFVASAVSLNWQDTFENALPGSLSHRYKMIIDGSVVDSCDCWDLQEHSNSFDLDDTSTALLRLYCCCNLSSVGLTWQCHSMKN